MPKDNLFANPIEKNVVNSIEGATALKLDESFEVKNSEEQNALFYSFENSEENKISEQTILNKSVSEEIPAGVSIESASYIENKKEDLITKSNLADDLIDEKNEKEYTPKLFSEDQPNEDVEKEDADEKDSVEQLFDQDTSMDEDFEIPAFLRRQKF